MYQRKIEWQKRLIVSFLLGILLPMGAIAQEKDKGDDKRSEVEFDKAACLNAKEEFSETVHEVIINGKPVVYKATAGNLLLKDDVKCEPQASMFFISYTKEGVEDLSERPITFCFNGGPGSSSIWLHLGVFGPKRVELTEQGDAIPPFRLINNEFSILDETDLVFIDPVSTGYSRAIPPSEAKRFHGVEEDVKSIAEFIRLYLTRFNRWGSPKFVAGESYGTTRAASLAGYLHEHSYLALNGIILVSSVLDFQSINFTVGNDLPYLAFLPSYTAAAWYHKKLDPELQSNLDNTLQKVRKFVIEEYSLALFKGNSLGNEDKQYITEQLSRFTGLSPEYIARNNLRIDMMRFAKELLRGQKKTIGRFDSRFQGIDADTAGEVIEYDPSADAIMGAFTAMLNAYIHTDLKWNKDTHYRILANVHPWDYSAVASNQYFNVSDVLRSVMTKNPYLRVFVANGYYDLATPFFATEYTFNHLNLDPSFYSHVMMKYYDAGHMMYIHYPSLVKMKEDLSHYYRSTLQKQEEEQLSNDQIRR